MPYYIHVLLKQLYAPINAHQCSLIISRWLIEIRYCNAVESHPLIRTPEVWPPLYSGHFE